MKKCFVLLMAAAVMIVAGCNDDEKEPSVVPVTGVSLSKSSTEIKETKTELILATVTPENATKKDVTWSSSDESVATVDKYGEISAVKEGDAIITVTTVDGDFKATCAVKVVPNVAVAVAGVTLTSPQDEIYTNQKIALVATVTPADADNKEITWSVSDESVVAINADGVLQGLKAGNVTITVTTAEGGKTATCAVTVSADCLVADFEWDNIGAKYTPYYSNLNADGSIPFIGICEVEAEPLDMEEKTPPEAVTIPRGTGKVLHLYGTQDHAEYGISGVHSGPEIEVTLPTGKLGDYKFLRVDMYFVTAAGNGGVTEPTNNWNAGAGWAGWGSPRLNIQMDAENSVFAEDFGGNTREMGSRTFPESVDAEDPATYWSAYTWARGVEFDLSQLKLTSEYQDLTTFKLALSIRSGALNCFVDNFVLIHK